MGLSTVSMIWNASNDHGKKKGGKGNERVEKFGALNKPNEIDLGQMSRKNYVALCRIDVASRLRKKNELRYVSSYDFKETLQVNIAMGRVCQQPASCPIITYKFSK